MQRRQFMYLSLLATAACSPAVSPVGTPDVGMLNHHRFAGDPNPTAPTMQASRWWQTLGSTRLNTLVARLIADNPDLAAAGFRVLQSELQAANARSRRAPTVTGAGSGSATSATGPTSARDTTTSYTLGATVSWETDLFGRIAAEGDAAAADLLSAHHNREALANSLIAALIRSFIATAFDKRQIAATRRVIASREATLSVSRERFSLGVQNAIAGTVLSAQESLAAARADLPDQQLSLVRNINALDVTLGQLPVSRDRYGISLPEEPPARSGGVGVPVDLLRRRPDIRAAEASLVAANANIRVSLADRFPSLSLTGSLQTRGADLGDLLDVDTLVASLVADLVQTVFDAGRGTRLVALRKAQAQELAQSYVATVLTAVSEVENALAAERLLAERARLLRARRDAARAAMVNARDRYQQGTGDYLTLLDASRSEVNAENAYLAAQRNRWITRVDLLLALGGGWTAPAAPRKAEETT